MRKRVSIVGATGYAGGELTALLARHPAVEVADLFSSGRGMDGRESVPFDRLHPALAGAAGPHARPFEMDALRAGRPDAVFLATPNEFSAEIVPRLVDSGSAHPGTAPFVIDLSGAFRLRDGAAYPAWYGFEHPAPRLLERAVYGLTEWRDGDLAGARLVANPGCYATAVLLALKPVRDLLDDRAPLVCDVKSGVSGAGRRSDPAWSFAELAGNFKAYGASGHRHEPEIRQELGLSADAALSFVPHLLPLVRGILATLHVVFVRPVEAEEIAHRFRDAYADARFVRVLPAGALPEIRDVAGTPRAEIGFVLRAGGSRGVVVSVLDNLLKGAASQAIQNMNRVFGFDEAAGLA